MSSILVVLDAHVQCLSPIIEKDLEVKSPAYLRRFLIVGSTLFLVVTGLVVGAAPSLAAPGDPDLLPINYTGSDDEPIVAPNSSSHVYPHGCPDTSTNPLPTQQPIVTDTAVALPDIDAGDDNAPPFWFLNNRIGYGNANSGRRPSGWNADGLATISYGIANCDSSESYYVVASDPENQNGTSFDVAEADETWEGSQVVTDSGTKTVSVNLYVDSAQSNQVSGFFANGADLGIVYVGFDGSSDGDCAPKSPDGTPESGDSDGTDPAVFCNPSDNTVPLTDNGDRIREKGWYVFDSTKNSWQQVSGVSISDGWHNLEISINSDGNYVYYVNGQAVIVTADSSFPYSTLGDVSLANYNDGINATDTWFQNLSSSVSNTMPSADDEPPGLDENPSGVNNNPSGSSSGPTTKLTVRRLSGSDRYATAVAISKSGHPSRFAAGTGVVVLATGTNYADALSGAPLAAKYGGVLLLTRPASLPTEVKTELQRLNPKDVIVLGGYGAVSQSVYAQVRVALPGVKLVQVAGADRYATSLLIAQKYFSGTGANTGTGNEVDSAFVATGTAFPDALSAAAAAGETTTGKDVEIPVLLVNGTGSTVPAALTEWLTTNVTQHLYVAGGSGAVSPAVVKRLASNLKGTVVRFVGTDRYDTNVLIDGNDSANAANNSNISFFAAPTTVYLATGANFPDALTGGAAAGYQNAPLFLTKGTCIPANVLSAIQNWHSVTTVNVLGGTGVQSADVMELKSC